MSYCGQCGGFFAPTCPHYPLCCPAPNPHEERAAKLNAAAAVAQAQISGMVADNQHAERCGSPPKFDGWNFRNIADNLRREIGK